MDVPMKIRWAKNRRRGIVAHQNRVISAVKSSFNESDGPNFLRDFSFKNDVLPL